MSRYRWLGRLLEQQYPDYLTNPPTVPPAIQMGSDNFYIFNNSDEFDI
ncbi:MAG: hypothetical protein R2795_26835 [Saprospiraceae bacterium]